MTEQQRLAFLEEIGSTLVALEAGGKQRAMNGQGHPTHAIEFLDAVFITADGEEWSTGLANAIHALAGDIYYFEDFDLRDAVRVELRSDGGIPCW